MAVLLTPETGIGISAAPELIDDGSVRETDTLAQQLAALQDQFEKQINAADLPPSDRDRLMEHLHRDLGGITGTNSMSIQQQIQLIRSIIKQEINKELAEEEAEKSYKTMKQIFFIEEQIHEAERKEAAAQASMAFSFGKPISSVGAMLTGGHKVATVATIDEVSEPETIGDKVAAATHQALEGIRHVARDVEHAMQKTSVGRGTVDYVKQGGKALHSEATAAGALFNFTAGAVTGNAEQLRQGKIVLKTGFDRRTDMVQDKAGTLGEIGSDLFSGNFGGATDKLVTGIRRNIIGDHTNNEIDKLLPELEAKGWGKLKDRNGNDLFGIGNGHLTSKHIREVAEAYGIRIKDEDGTFTGREMTDILNQVVQKDRLLAAQAQAKAAAAKLAASDTNHDGKVDANEKFRAQVIEDIRKAGSISATYDKNHDGKVDVTEVVAALKAKGITRADQIDDMGEFKAAMAPKAAGHVPAHPTKTK